MERKLRTCAVCGRQYKFCNLCREDADKPLWYFTFCSSNCYDIYGITSKFENEQINTNEAKEELEKLDLPKNLGTSYKNSISKIMNSVYIPVDDKADDIIEAIAVTNNTVIVSEENSETIEVIDEEKVFKKPRNKKAKNDIEE